MAPARDQRGSAVVEFVLVAPLVALLALAVVQIALLLQARATLTAAATEGARAAALSGNDPAAGVRRAEQILDQNPGVSSVRRVSAHRALVDGLKVMTVQIDADVALLGYLGLAPMTVEGHSLVEELQ
jgi:Flp pilus assembly protein TadG